MSLNYLLSEMFYLTNDRVDSEKWKKEILIKFKKSKNLPRKKKKQVRKELNLDWQIACWNPNFNN
jgi:hypothetical protein